MTDSMLVTLTVNGRFHEIAVRPNAVLLHVLRDLGYTDVKNGCEIGECGACAVLLDGRAANSCMVLAAQADGATIVTNSGLGTLDKPHVIQEAFADAGAVQCGFCTSGMVISAKALLDRNPDPTEAEIREALSGNLCRCTGYGQIVEAVRLAAKRLRDLASIPASSRSEEGRESQQEEGILASSDVAASEDKQMLASSDASSQGEEGREADPQDRLRAVGDVPKSEGARVRVSGGDANGGGAC